LQTTNIKNPAQLLKEHVLKLVNYPNYEYIVAFTDKNKVGIPIFW
jgi:hypothetical protein